MKAVDNDIYTDKEVIVDMGSAMLRPTESKLL